MSVSLTITKQTCVGANVLWLEAQLRRVLSLLKIRKGSWSITIVHDAAMKALHKKTMGLSTTTDVLTFDLSEGKELDLDTVICRDEAQRRAAEMKHSVRSEVLLYAIHSLLHVQGYDDVTPAKAARMHRREDEILLHSGVGAVYQKSSGGAAAKRPAEAPRRKSTKSQAGNGSRNKS